MTAAMIRCVGHAETTIVRAVPAPSVVAGGVAGGAAAPGTRPASASRPAPVGPGRSGDGMSEGPLMVAPC